MKKSKAIELLKAQTHSIKMDRREEQDIQLLNEILEEVCPEDYEKPTGSGNFYFITGEKPDYWFGYAYNQLPHHINISEIEVDEEFVNGEYYEFSDNGNEWIGPFFYIGKTKDGFFACQSENVFISKFNHIRKSPPTERDKAIKAIKELKDKFNIKNEEI
jgi:hypothetical protein